MKQNWIQQFGDKKIQHRAIINNDLRRALSEALEEIYLFVDDLDIDYELEALVTDSKENMIRIRINYLHEDDRDLIWDRAAQTVAEQSSKWDVDILCGIKRLRK